MLGTLLKKKISDNQLANIFINTIFNSVEQGFGEVSQFMNEDQAFVTKPSIDTDNDGEFAFIILVGNITYLDEAFEPEQSVRIEKIIIEKLATIYQMTVLEFEELLSSYKSYIQRVNHPSKNMLYGMSKAVFYKYKLNDYQDEYFKRMQVPNPLFLKRMDEIMSSFIWDWNMFFKKYRIN